MSIYSNKLNSIISWFSDRNKQLLFFVIAIATFTITTFILNWLYPTVVDDWDYTFVYGDSVTRRIHNINDLITSQYNFYMSWGGRTVVHSIAQVLLQLKPIYQDILNTVVYLILIYTIYKIANFNNKVRPSVLIIIVTMFCWLQPAIVATTLWITGSANYLWSMTIIILFIYPFYTYYRTEKTISNLFVSLLYLPFGIIVGWTNENMCIAMIFFIIGAIYLYKRQGMAIPAWAIIGLIGIVIGAFFLITAPGNQVRYVEEIIRNTGQAPEESLTSIKALIFRIPKMLFLYFKRLLWLCVPYLILLHYFKKQEFSNHTERAKILHTSLLFFYTANIAFFVMIASPGIPSRAFFGIISLFIIAIAILYANLNLKTERAIRTNFLVLSLSCLSLIIDFTLKCKNIYLIKSTLERREIAIEEGKKKGQKDFIFTDGIKVRNKYFFNDCTDDPNFWINSLYSRYYGINSIKVTRKNK
mgnify:CR=1 FL=1